MDKNPMPEQCPNVRNKNFLEVTTGYTEEMAIDEAQRCLNCKHKPCMQGCPVSVKIPEFIALLQRVNLKTLIRRLRKQMHFLLFAAEYVRRKSSVNQSV